MGRFPKTDLRHTKQCLPCPNHAVRADKPTSQANWLNFPRLPNLPPPYQTPPFAYRLNHSPHHQHKKNASSSQYPPPYHSALTPYKLPHSYVGKNPLGAYPNPSSTIPSQAASNCGSTRLLIAIDSPPLPTNYIGQPTHILPLQTPLPTTK